MTERKSEQAATECYWRFAEHNGTPVYGWGTEEEASQYQDHLNEYWDHKHYQVEAVSEADAEQMKLGDEAFVIEAKIAELKAQGDWKED